MSGLKPRFCLGDNFMVGCEKVGAEAEQACDAQVVLVMAEEGAWVVNH